MKKIIKKYQVWRNSKNKDLWAVLHRDLETVSVIPVKGNREIRVVNLNKFLKKYYFDTTYYLLHGDYESIY